MNDGAYAPHLRDDIPTKKTMMIYMNHHFFLSFTYNLHGIKTTNIKILSLSGEDPKAIDYLIVGADLLCFNILTAHI